MQKRRNNYRCLYSIVCPRPLKIVLLKQKILVYILAFTVCLLVASGGKNMGYAVKPRLVGCLLFYSLNSCDVGQVTLLGDVISL